MARAQGLACPPSTSRISVERGWYQSSPGVRYRLTDFRATLVANGKRAPLCYQKTTVVSQARIFVTNDSLSNVFSQKLKKAGSSIKDFKVRNSPLGATLTGLIVKVIPVRFSIEAPVATDGHDIQLTARSIKADGLPIQEVLKLVGMQLNSILQVNGMRGIEVKGSALSFSPEALAHLKGHISGIQTSSQGLTLFYGPDPSVQQPTTAH